AVTDAVFLPTAYNGRSRQPVYAAAASPVPLDIALDRLMASYDAGGQASARYVHGTGLLGAEDASGVFAAALSDAMGNVVVRVNEAGQVIDRAVYGPYGDLYGRTANGTSPFLFNGGYGVRNDGNRLLYMRARSYAPAQFRFLQPDFLLGDPMRPQSLNRYAFALGNPLQANDPTGLAVIAVIAFGVGFVVGLGIGAAIAYCVGGGAAGGAGLGGAGLGGFPEAELEPLLNEEGSGSELDVDEIEMTEINEPVEINIDQTSERYDPFRGGLRRRNG